MSEADGYTADGRGYVFTRFGMHTIVSSEIHFNGLVRLCYENSKAHGFWEGSHDNPYEKLALIHSEVSEVLELLRAGHWVPDRWQEDDKPEGIGSELADIIIRVMDFAGRYDIDLYARLREKMEYNTGRKFMHGKQA